MRHTVVGALLTVCLLCSVAVAAEPSLTLNEAGGGMWIFTGTGTGPAALTVAQGAPIDFSWSANPGDGTAITDYRYGWDILDPNDDADPGWTAWGSATSAPPLSFSAGAHTFTVEARNDLGQKARGVVVITLEPPVSARPSTWGAVKARY